MANRKTKNQMTQKEKKFHLELIRQMLQLATSGFGLAAALAWNDTIKTLIDEYIKPYASQGSGLLSQVIYTLAVTALAVTITYQLTKVKERFTNRNK
ncbi:MAG: hypothetical protein HYU80_04175 [Candidatus Blackburnbacteria bacterium]|nr:hypothetical protein [Candidatus Blackburnbacteria bacterium]